MPISFRPSQKALLPNGIATSPSAGIRCVCDVCIGPKQGAGMTMPVLRVPVPGKASARRLRSVSAASQRRKATSLGFCRCPPERLVAALLPLSGMFMSCRFSFIGRYRQIGRMRTAAVRGEKTFRTPAVRRPFRFPCDKPSDPPFLFPVFPDKTAYFSSKWKIASRPVCALFPASESPRSSRPAFVWQPPPFGMA